jgi:hypothetical protein
MKIQQNSIYTNEQYINRQHSNIKSNNIEVAQLDTNKAVVVAVREPPLRLISIGFSPQLHNSYLELSDDLSWYSGRSGWE